MLICRNSELSTYRLDICVGIIVVRRRRPAVGNVTDGINALSLVRQQVAAQRADTMLRSFEFSKSPIITSLTNPRVGFAVLEVAGVIVPDAAGTVATPPFRYRTAGACCRVAQFAIAVYKVDSIVG